MDVPDAVGQPRSSQTKRGSADTQGGLNKDDTLLPGVKEKDRIHGRIKTYGGWTGPVSPIQLAIAGFEFTGENDLVICIVCNLKFFNWRTDMKPLDVHKQFSPNCSFLKRWYSVDEAKEKVEERKAGYESSEAKHQVFVEFVKRVASFATWPHKGKDQSPQNMAIAGFFYMGSSDRAQCFYCGLILRDWDLNHDPVSAHKQWSPHCAYIQHISQGGSNIDQGLDVTDHVGSSARVVSMSSITTGNFSPSTSTVASASTGEGTITASSLTTRRPSASVSSFVSMPSASVFGSSTTKSATSVSTSATSALATTRRGSASMMSMGSLVSTSSLPFVSRQIPSSNRLLTSPLPSSSEKATTSPWKQESFETASGSFSASRRTASSGTASSGTASSGTAANGTASSGRTSSGTASSGTASSGTASSGTASSGTASSGTASSGSASKGTVSSLLTTSFKQASNSSPSLRSRSLPQTFMSESSTSSTPQNDVPNRQPPMIQALLDWGFELYVIQQGIRRHRERTGGEVKNASELLRVLEEQ